MTVVTITQPQATTSAVGPMSWAANWSGAMYVGVPTTPPVACAPASSVRAMPKSMTRGPSEPSSTLAGLKSRWTTPASWMAAGHRRAVTSLPEEDDALAALTEPARQPVPAECLRIAWARRRDLGHQSP